MKTNHNHIHNDTRLALLEQSIGYISETMMRFEKRFDSIDKDMKEGFSKLDVKIEKLDSDIKSNFKYTITTIISLFVLSGLLPIFTHWVSKFIGQ